MIQTGLFIIEMKKSAPKTDKEYLQPHKINKIIVEI